MNSDYSNLGNFSAMQSQANGEDNVLAPLKLPMSTIASYGQQQQDFYHVERNANHNMVNQRNSYAYPANTGTVSRGRGGQRGHRFAGNSNGPRRSMNGPVNARPVHYNSTGGNYNGPGPVYQHSRNETANSLHSTYLNSQNQSNFGWGATNRPVAVSQSFADVDSNLPMDYQQFGQSELVITNTNEHIFYVDACEDVQEDVEISTSEVTPCSSQAVPSPTNACFSPDSVAFSAIDSQHPEQKSVAHSALNSSPKPAANVSVCASSIHDSAKQTRPNAVSNLNTSASASKVEPRSSFDFSVRDSFIALHSVALIRMSISDKKVTLTYSTSSSRAPSAPNHQLNTASRTSTVNGAEQLFVVYDNEIATFGYNIAGPPCGFVITLLNNGAARVKKGFGIPDDAISKEVPFRIIAMLGFETIQVPHLAELFPNVVHRLMQQSQRSSPPNTSVTSIMATGDFVHLLEKTREATNALKATRDEQEKRRKATVSTGISVGALIYSTQSAVVNCRVPVASPSRTAVLVATPTRASLEPRSATTALNGNQHRRAPVTPTRSQLMVAKSLQQTRAGATANTNTHMRLNSIIRPHRAGTAPKLGGSTSIIMPIRVTRPAGAAFGAHSTNEADKDEQRLFAPEDTLTFPRIGRDSWTLSNVDLATLRDYEFLNDGIINFYLKWIYYQLLPTKLRERTYIFNTFFYSRLTDAKASSTVAVRPSPAMIAAAAAASVKRESIAAAAAANTTEEAEDDETADAEDAARASASEGYAQSMRQKHANVKKWTRNVDLFDKDFILIPINVQAHWLIAVVCYPGDHQANANNVAKPVLPSGDHLNENDQSRAAETEETEESTASKRPRLEDGPTPETAADDVVDAAPVSTPEAELIAPAFSPLPFDSPSKTLDEANTPVCDNATPVIDLSALSPPCDTKQRQLCISNSNCTASSLSGDRKVQGEAVEQKDPATVTVTAAAAANPKVVEVKSSNRRLPDEVEADSIFDRNREPCVILFDSLVVGKPKYQVARDIREYLQVEWDTRKAAQCGPRTFVSADKCKQITTHYPQLPPQTNCYDCGLYLLEYAERFFCKPIRKFTKSPKRPNLSDWFLGADIDKKRQQIRKIIFELYDEQLRERNVKSEQPPNDAP